MSLSLDSVSSNKSRGTITLSKVNAVSPDNVEIEKEDSIPNEDSVQKRASLRLNLAVSVSRIIPILAAIGAVGYLTQILTDESAWETNDDASDEDKLSREKTRGTFVSVLISILLNVIGAFMFHIGVKEGLVVTNYGFILGPVIGFILDQGIATDLGFKSFLTADGFKFTFASLVGGNFLRYIITVFLDLFLSNPLQDVLKRQAKLMGIIKRLANDVENSKGPWLKSYDHFVALNFPSILQSIVAFITFNAYTNQTRFAWAYPAATLDRDLRIPPGTIMLSTAIAGVLYLNFYTIMDTFSDREYFDVNTKLLYVMATLCILYGLNSSDSIEAPIEGEDSNSLTASFQDQKPLMGFALFACFVLYGFVYPIWTRLGCACLSCCGGRCKPSQRELAEHDHMIDEPEAAMALSKPMLEAIKAQMFSLRTTALQLKRQSQKVLERTENKARNSQPLLQ